MIDTKIKLYIILMMYNYTLCPDLVTVLGVNHKCAWGVTEEREW